MAKRVLSIEEVAAEVGRLLGTTETHARRWLDQRQTLLRALGTVRDKANNLMAELGEIATSGRRKRGRPAAGMEAVPFADTPRKRRGRRKISDATRAKMRAAAQKRWAERRKAAGGSKRGSLTATRTVNNARPASK
jgi:hypothetical protein